MRVKLGDAKTPLIIPIKSDEIMDMLQVEVHLPITNLRVTIYKKITDFGRKLLSITGPRLLYSKTSTQKTSAKHQDNRVLNELQMIQSDELNSWPAHGSSSHFPAWLHNDLSC